VENIGGFLHETAFEADFEGYARTCNRNSFEPKQCSGQTGGRQIFFFDLLIWLERWLRLNHVEAANAWILGDIMQWTAPAFEEVCLNCEINSYASAKL
jgi:coenzyme PQQ precursor peptide PqqA